MPSRRTTIKVAAVGVLLYLLWPRFGSEGGQPSKGKKTGGGSIGTQQPSYLLSFNTTPDGGALSGTATLVMRQGDREERAVVGREGDGQPVLTALHQTLGAVSNFRPRGLAGPITVLLPYGVITSSLPADIRRTLMGFNTDYPALGPFFTSVTFA